MTDPAHNPTHISAAFAENFMAAPRACFFILNACLTVDQFRAGVARIEAGAINPQMPEYLSGFAATHGLDRKEGES